MEMGTGAASNKGCVDILEFYLSDLLDCMLHMDVDWSTWESVNFFYLEKKYNITDLK